tara:strand:+ start:279 stop:482 length:204 start_codon:yes stop_codon:yes gene_type:complete
LDEIWDKYDLDGNNLLDKDEAKPFISEICKLMIDKERAQNYDPNNFDQLFEEYDDDGNGFLSKGEMC